MNAPALNTATVPSATPAGQAPGLTGKAAATGPLAGFEALIAALFPAAAPGAAAPGQDAGQPRIAPDGAAKGKAGGKGAADKGDATDATVTDAATTDIAATDPTLTGADAAAAAALAALAAAQAATQGTTPQPVTTPAAGEAAADASATDPAVRARTLPFQVLREAKAGVPGKGEPAPEALTDDGAASPVADDEPALPGQRLGQVARDTDAKAPPAWGRDKPAGAPAEPALQAANPNARLAAKAAPPAGDQPTTPPAAPTVDTQAVVPQAQAADVQAQVASALPTPPAARAEPTQVGAPTNKAAKSEKAKASGEAAPVAEAKAPDAVQKTATGKPVEAAAKVDTPEHDAADAKPAAARADAGQPDAPLAAEARATDATATAPTAHAAHAVRGAPETVANLSAQIVKKLESKSTRFDVQLDPAGLGKVDVRVQIGADGRMSAAMSFDNPQAAAELKSRAGELRQALEQAGFDLSGGGLSFDVAGGGGQQQQQQAWQDQGDGLGRAFHGRAFRAALDNAGEAADAAVQGALKLRRAIDAGLDLRI